MSTNLPEFVYYTPYISVAFGCIISCFDRTLVDFGQSSTMLYRLHALMEATFVKLDVSEHVGSSPESSRAFFKHTNNDKILRTLSMLSIFIGTEVSCTPNAIPYANELKLVEPPDLVSRSQTTFVMTINSHSGFPFSMVILQTFAWIRFIPCASFRDRV